jgi:[ribosomal protein S18]-alanine N-acetyltransferase
MDKYIISALTEDMAKEICTWEYEGDYAVYNFSGWEEVVKNGWGLSLKEEREREFLGISKDNELIAYGRIFYQDGICILGVGLRPSLCGLGYGKDIMKVLIEESQLRYPNTQIALEVRIFNKRAIKCYESIGFEIKYKHIRSMDTGEAELYYMEYQQGDI